jgi:hypothetical protein
MANAYTIPEMEENNNKYLHNENELQSIDELPTLLRHGIYLTPTRWKKTNILLTIMPQIGMSFPIFSYITSSMVVGGIFVVCSITYSVCQVNHPDFTKGVFLDLLLKDAKVTKQINTNIFNGIVFNLIFFPFVISPLVWYFFLVPFATTTPGMLGPATFEITLIAGIVGNLSMVSQMIFSSVDYLPDQISLCHIDKIKRYLEKVRDLILNDNEEDGIPLVDKLTQEQEIVEKWILEINNGISIYNSFLIGGQFIFLIFFLSIVGSGYSIGATITFSIFSAFLVVFLIRFMYGIAKPNMAWKQQKIALLNNPKVISAILLKLKFPKENFESWLQNHNINASRIFGTKITFEKMKQTAGILTSAFGIAIYLLLRNELTSRGVL